MLNRLYYKKPALAWQEALAIGNGRIGGMVYGDLSGERIALNEDTLWSGYPKHNNNPDAYKHLKDIREAIFSGDYDRANKINNEDIRGFWSDAYLPFGDLFIDYKNAKGNNYERTLDLSKGLSVTKNDNVCETVFVSYPSQLMVVNIKSKNGVSFDVRLKSQLKHSIKAVDNCLVMTGKAPEICYPVYTNYGENVIYGDKGMDFCGIVKVLGDAKVNNDKIVVENQKEITLLISLATSFIDFDTMPMADAYNKALDYLDNNKNYDELLSEHCADFSELFDRVDIELGSDRANVPTDKRLKQFRHGKKDEGLIALLFQFGRYLTISGSRKGSIATTLQGIWNDKLRAPWSSNYTVNINTQMNYWCTDICNLSECFEPFADLIKKLCANGGATAKAYYNCNGAVAHHNVDIWGQTCPAGDHLGKTNTVCYAMWNSTLPWMLSEAYEHYRYTRDEDYLNELKPCYQAVLDFYKDFLIEHNGKLVTCPSISPENTFLDNGKRGNLTYMPTMDIGILEDFFNCCREIGLTDIPKLPPIPIGSDGRINEWAEEYEETEKHHRHASHLYCVYPSGVEQSDEVKNACRASLDARGLGGTGWALAWKACLWARLGEPEIVAKLIKNQLYPIKARGFSLHIGGGSYPNMFDAHPPFQIDGNFGISAGIAEMFKAKKVPKSWKGYAKGIKLYDGKILNIEFCNGVVKEIK